MRILPNQEYLTYFEHQGMPVTTSLLEYSGDASHWNGLAMMQDPRLDAFREWVKEHGTVAFIKFLWHYKADALQMPLNDPVAVLAPNLYYYSATGFTPILENSRFSEVLYPMDFGVIVFWLANMFAAFISAFATSTEKGTVAVALADDFARLPSDCICVEYGSKRSIASFFAPKCSMEIGAVVVGFSSH